MEVFFGARDWRCCPELCLPMFLLTSSGSGILLPAIHLLFWGFGFSRRQRQAGGVVEQASLLGRELVSELIGVDELIALLRRHVAQSPNRSLDGVTPVWGQLVESPADFARLVLLIRSEVLPDFHPSKDLVLLWSRQGREYPQLS